MLEYVSFSGQAGGKAVNEKWMTWSALQGMNSKPTHGNFPDFKNCTGYCLYCTLPFVGHRTGIPSGICRVSGGPVHAILRVSLDYESLGVATGNRGVSCHVCFL